MEQWLTDPPFSLADLIRAPADIAAAGERWRSVPEDFLVGVVGREGSTSAPHVREGAQAELQRRNVDAQRVLEAAVRQSTTVYSAHASASRS